MKFQVTSLPFGGGLSGFLAESLKVFWVFKPVCLSWMLHFCKYCSIQFTKTGIGEWKGREGKNHLALLSWYNAAVSHRGSLKICCFCFRLLCLILTTVTHSSVLSPRHTSWVSTSFCSQQPRRRKMACFKNISSSPCRVRLSLSWFEDHFQMIWN